MKKLIQKIAKQHNINVKFYKDKLTKESKQEFQDKVDWGWISKYQILSEDFIREFQDKVYWGWISRYQILSEDFIREFQDKVNWYCISRSQILSEEFIREFQDKVFWGYISQYQILFEEFIREFQDKVYWGWISQYQILSEEFKNEFNVKIPEICWLYKSKKEKLEYIKSHTNYKIIDDEYILAYKSVKRDNRSVYRPQSYLYEVGKEYKSNCDCNIDNNNSFGLSAWTKEEALKYYSKGNLLKVRINIEDIGAIIPINKKIRCFKQKIIDKIDFNEK